MLDQESGEPREKQQAEHGAGTAEESRSPNISHRQSFPGQEDPGDNGRAPWQSPRKP
ncbi:MAG: hypothetical protein DHS20C21_05110 [Gemmatimonadota bacterium]|nr:MAG: hypothetical protein DHS20C21_05110 [Gemmatimonadota bacterium]